MSSKEREQTIAQLSRAGVPLPKTQESTMYGFISKQGRTYTLDIRTSSDISRGELVAQRFMVSKNKARTWCKEYNARPWNF